MKWVVEHSSYWAYSTTQAVHMKTNGTDQESVRNKVAMTKEIGWTPMVVADAMTHKMAGSDNVEEGQNTGKKTERNMSKNAIKMQEDHLPEYTVDQIIPNIWTETK